MPLTKGLVWLYLLRGSLEVKSGAMDAFFKQIGLRVGGGGRLESGTAVGDPVGEEEANRRLLGDVGGVDAEEDTDVAEEAGGGDAVTEGGAKGDAEGGGRGGAEGGGEGEDGGEDGGCIAVHVRHGDACSPDYRIHGSITRTCYPLSIYVRQIRRMLELYGSKRQVYLSTDDPHIIEEATTRPEYSDIRWIYQTIDRSKYDTVTVIDDRTDIETPEVGAEAFKVHRSLLLLLLYQ
jgi:hypothetical protein